ncbi:hypothetical protein ACFL09_03715, partial [Planctomycetota bacterium]
MHPLGATSTRGRACAVAVISFMLLPLLALAGEFQPPAGYHLVAEDNCGEADAMPHVVRGKEYVYPTHQAKGPYDFRTIVFDNQFCLLRYKKPKPKASYKVDVVYVTQKEAQRVQRLEANGHEVHGELPLPLTVPKRFLFDIPRAAYADGKDLTLKFIHVRGGNAVVCYVRIWSTDKTPLDAHTMFWSPQGPIEHDWARQDRLRGRPSFVDWKAPAKEVRGSVVPCINEQLERGKRVLAELDALGAEGMEPSAAELAAVAAQRDGLLAAKTLDPEPWCKVYREARWAVRRLVLKHPGIEGDGLLFVRRHHPHTMHQCSRRLGPFTLPGGGICVLRKIPVDGKAEVECISEGTFPNGTFSRPDLSFDGRRIVFGHAPERKGGKPAMDYGHIRRETAPLFAEHKVGYCQAFQVWEMGLDGRSPKPRQLTQGPNENSDPIYLPDGRIAFMSHRYGGLVQCGDWALAYCVYTMQPDGSGVRKITMAKDGEWDPVLLADGSIGFTRWEYVMKFWSPIQMLWRVRPDGANPHIIYGSDLSRRYAYPLNYAVARQVPGTSKLACIGSAHHNTGAGPVCTVDLRLGRDIAQGLRRVTPVRFVETPDKRPSNGWYDHPYPLSDGYFLVSYSFSANERASRSYGIYLLDACGGKELIYRDRELSALFPMPIRPRRRPVEVASTIHPPGGSQPPGGSPDFGEFLILNVHEGLPESVRGQARYLRVVEANERHVHTNPYAVQVGPDSGFETKAVLGTVPVEADGSARFRMPADTSVFFTVLDGKFQALHTMRAATDVRAGERTACIGCHEPMAQAPANHPPSATARHAVAITPPPWGVRPMSYRKLVQPLLDRHCVRCHDVTKPDGGVVLSGDLTKTFNVAYEALNHHNRDWGHSIHPRATKAIVPV